MNIFRNIKSESLESNKVQHGKETVQKMTQFHNENSGFIQDMSKLLAENVKQHHIVDNEHDVLGQLFDKVKIHMNEISNLTKNTNGLTDRLYSARNNLRDITSETIINHIEAESIADRQLEEIKNTVSTLQLEIKMVKNVADILYEVEQILLELLIELEEIKFKI